MVSQLSPEEKAVIVSFPYSPARFAVTILSAVRFLLRFSPDLMICSLWRASMIGIIVKIMKKKIKLYSFVHNTMFFHALDRTFTALALNNADGVLTDSKATSAFVLSRFNPTVPVHIISFFTDSSPLQRTNAPLQTQKGVRFIYLGRIDPIKNIPSAIDVIHYLRSENIDASLDLFGNNNEYCGEVIEYIKNKNLQSVVQFKGELHPISRLKIFKNYNFLIQLSQAEGMAMSVAEAMQNGIVCVVTPVGEIPNYSEDMKSAIFVDTWTVQGWKQSLKKIERVIRNPELYDAISVNCWNESRSVKSYSDSLIACIRNGQHDMLI